MPERIRRKVNASRKGKKRPDVETRLKNTVHKGKALGKSQSYFETVLWTMREPLVVLDADCRVVSANRAFYGSYSVKQEDVEGKSIFELGDKAWNLPMLREIIGEVLSEGKILEGLLVDHDFPVIGRRVLLVNASPMAEESGQFNRIVLTFSDVTSLKKAEEEVRSLAPFPAENPNPVLRISKDGEILYSNKAGLLILDGWKCQVGQSVPSKLRQLVADVFESGRKREIEEEHDAQTFLMMFAPIADGVNVYGRDITERKKAEMALQQSEEKYRSIVKTAQEGMMLASLDGRIVFANERMAHVLGYTVEELTGKSGLELVPEKERDRAQERMKIRQQGIKEHYEVLMRRKDGSEVYMLASGAPLFDAQGRHTGNLGMYTDITERKKAEEELRKSEEMARQRAEELEKIMDLVPNALWVSRDPECRMITGNIAANQFYEAQSGENVSAGPAAGGEQDSTRRFFQNGQELRPEELPMQEAATTGAEIRNSEVDVLLPSGKKITILGSATPLKDSDGKIRGCVASFMDITERKKAEEALLKAHEELEMRVQVRTQELSFASEKLQAEIIERKRAEEAIGAERKRFNDALENLPAYLILLTPDYHVSYANRAFRERFGEGDGKRCFEFLFGRTEPCKKCETYRTLEKMAPLEWEWTGPDGHNYYVYDSPFTDVDGSTLIMEVGIDITERKQAEEALRKAHEELEERVKERTKELRESQTDLSHAQAVAKTGSWRLDVKRNELLWSEETYRIFGVPKGTPLTYETFLTHVHPDDKAYVDLSWQAAVRGEPYDIEHRIVVNGEVKWVREKAELESGNDNILLGGFGTVQDVTERKKAEEELRETTDYLDSLLDYANAPIIVWDPEFRITRFNHAFERLSGYKAEEVFDKHLSVLFPERSTEESLTEIQHTLAGEQWEGVEIPILRKDGNVRTVLWNSANIHAADGKTLLATIAQGQDITERKLLEEKVFQSERKYRSLYETSIDGIVSVDLEGRITECNDSYAHMLGYSKDELKEMTYVQLTPEKWHQMEQEIVREQVTKRGHSDLYEKEYIRKDGSIMPISIRTWLVRDERWAPIGMWAIVRDITRSKHLENELRRYSEHLEHLVEERTKKLKDAERLAAIGETAAMVGHDIRNPLQTVEGAIYLAKEEIKALPSRTQEISNIEEMLNSIHEETTYVNKIVSDLQDYARPLEPQLEEIDTKQLINGALVTVQIASTIEVSVTVEQDCCTMIADPTMMKRILANLITNALQAMPDGGKLTLAAFRQQDEVHLSVQDTGQGIPDENRAKVFQPLFTTKAKGQGFGLAVVKRLVEAHTGTITFNSEVGIGTTFIVAIPVAKEAN